MLGRRSIVVALLVSFSWTTWASAEVRPQLRFECGAFRGKLADGPAKAQNLISTSGQTQIPGGIGGTGGGGGLRKVPALAKDEDARRVAADVTRILAAPADRLSSHLQDGVRFTVTPIAIVGDRLHAEVFFECTAPTKGDDEEHVLATSGTCYRQMGKFPIGKTCRVIGPVDMEGNTTWLEFTFSEPKKEMK